MPDYYLEETDGFVELRQTKYRDCPKHPHTVCAIGQTVDIVLSMYDEYLTGGVEGHREA